MNTYIKGLIFSILSILCFSFNETLGSLGFKVGVSSITLILVRFVVASLLFALTIVIWKPSLFKVARKDIGWILLPGVIILGETFSYWQSIKILNSISLVMTLFYLCPLWTALLFRIFKGTKFNKNIWLSILLAISGIALSSGFIPNGFYGFNWLGSGLALLSGLGWSFYFISLQKIIDKYHSFTILFYSFSLVAIFFLCLQNPIAAVSQLNMTSWLILLSMGVFTTFLSYLLLTVAVHFNKAVKSISLDTLSTPLSIALAFFVLGQRITILQSLGVLMILSITYLLNEHSGKSSNTNN